jgi:hypothetical protein
LPFIASIVPPDSRMDEIRVAYNNFKRGRNKPHIPVSNRQAIFYQLDTQARFEKGDTKSQKIIPAIARRFRHELRTIVFLDPQPALMRGYSFAKDSVMKENGSNLSSVLYNICESDSHLKKKLLDFVRSLPEQDIKDIDFIVTERNDVMVMLIESFGNKETTMDAPMLSDGTLRVLATGATLLSAPSGSLVIIEEIDTSRSWIASLRTRRLLKRESKLHYPGWMGSRKEYRMSAICLIDTSIFLEILDVPRKATRHEHVILELQRKMEDGETLFLPMATILETGNHIAQNGDGKQRRACALNFVSQVQDALNGKSPFKPDLYLIPGWSFVILPPAS